MNRGAIRRRLALGLALLTTSATLTLAVPGNAHAAAPEAVGTACSGRKIKTLPFSTGSVRVYKRGGTFCVITLPKNPGPRQYMMVSVQARGFHPSKDEGMYTRFAGPRGTHAGQRKVRVKGAVGAGSVDTGWVRF
ncbi:hypothetical protein K4B79_44630 [Streptomyces lincolnensis]|uniref:hypothetical protein n=1 Tax=Streptomyces lincolnensis TaxID=1915 RepID=UPI001E3F0708|nr:hypothetical protein [Streptomyces lincolnensis]MCD7445254.1 hypothetical protein [Streptomyces lincolnensis]